MSAWRSALVVIVIVLAGCTSPTALPPPIPMTSERYGAPVVTRPLDVTALFADPCSQFTNAELDELAIYEAGTPRSYLGDSECRWSSREGDIFAMSVDRDRDLLADTYRARLFPIFQPITVAGYPAVRERRNRENNNCIVTVGLGPRQALRTDWTGLGTFRTGDPDPCERAENAAAMIVRKLPPR